MNDKGEGTVRLRRALESDDRHERAEAAVKLGYAGARDALDELKSLLSDPDDLVAVSAMFACWQLGVRPVPLERAVASLASPDEETVQATVHALCEMGEEVVPDLASLLEEGSPHTPDILRILGDIGGDRALAAVRRAARTGEPEIVHVAQAVLDEWGE